MVSKCISSITVLTDGGNLENSKEKSHKVFPVKEKVVVHNLREKNAEVAKI